MNSTKIRSTFSLVLILISTTSHAGWMELNEPPETPVNTPCEGYSSLHSSTCHVGTLSAATSGFSLVASTSRPIITVVGPTTTQVGILYDRAYYNPVSGEAIFALRIELNGNPWHPPYSDTFQVNEVIREGFANIIGLEAGYAHTAFIDEWSYAIGRTGYFPNSENYYDLNSVGWLTDVNVYDPDGVSPGNTAWFLTKFSNENLIDIEEAPGVFRLLGTDVDVLGGEVVMSGYVPVFASPALLSLAPVPEPSEYAMLLVGLGLVGSIARRRMQ